MKDKIENICNTDFVKNWSVIRALCDLLRRI